MTPNQQDKVKEMEEQGYEKVSWNHPTGFVGGSVELENPETGHKIVVHPNGETEEKT